MSMLIIVIIRLGNNDDGWNHEYDNDIGVHDDYDVHD
jgi:hypothetical protein